jgi:Rne/Rng family ribonuclease
MKKEMLINVLQPEECRIAIIENGVLEELYVERTSQESYVGNIYKGRIVNIEPSIQAAFVDFGIGRNGFLHISDVDPAYYQHLTPRRGERRDDDRDRDRDRGRGRGRGGRDRDQDRRGGRRRDRHESAPIEYPPTVVDEPKPLSTPSNAAETSSVWGAAMEILGLADAPQPISALPHTMPSNAEVPEWEPDGTQDSSAIVDDRTSDSNESERPEEISKPQVMPAIERHSEPPTGGFGAGILDQDAAASETSAAIEQSEGREEAMAAEDLSWDEPESAANEIDSAEAATAESFEEFDDGQEESEELRPPEAESEPADLLDMELEDGEVPQPRARSHDRGDRRGRGPGRGRGGPRRGGRPGFGRPKPLIQDVFRRGQEVLIQVIKEGIGTKGPTLSTYISIAGRYLVLMPGLNRIGVSRKIEDEEARGRLKEILTDLRPPNGLGFIIRTAGIDRNKRELQNDLNYLLRLWEVMVRRIKKLKSPAEIYQESDMITRTIRDTFTADIDTIWVDEANAFAHAEEFSQIVMPRYANRIKHFQEAEPLFHKYGIEAEIARIQQRKIPLPMGGSIVIEQTEALVAIDVNSGSFRAENNAEETAYQMNLQAAKEIGRQLRLRDLGGVIVNDFIDMRDEKHKRGVERALRDALRRDRARTKILKISQFGLIEMTRQRIRPSLKRSVYHECPHCTGTGLVKTGESMSIEVMRLLQLAAHRDGITRIQVRVHDEVASYLLNRKRKEIAQLEGAGELQILISGSPAGAPEQLEIVSHDRNGNEIRFPATEPPPRPQDRTRGRFQGGR